MELNVLVACEESQEVCKAFRERGHRAFSADLQECSGGHPEWHIQGDVLPILNGNCTFITSDTHTHTQDGRWDLIIAHPPCTYLTVSGNGWFNVERYGEKALKRARDRDEAVQFFMEFVNADCEHIAIENPIGTINTLYRRPDCIIHPYFFGDPVRKATCLWLKNLPVLTPTRIVKPNVVLAGNGASTYSGPAYVAVDENGKRLSWSDPKTAKIRSKTYHGFAQAMAEQWSRYLESETKYAVIYGNMQFKLFE